MESENTWLFTHCFNCRQESTGMLPVAINNTPVSFCKTCHDLASKIPHPHRYIGTDMQYCSFRLQRNQWRDLTKNDWDTGPIKRLDYALELYERRRGTDACAVIYHDFERNLIV